MIKQAFEEVLAKIKANQKLKLEGKSIGVPYPFPRLERELGGIQKGQVIQLTANSGVGKSRISRFLFVYSVYAHYLRTGYRVRILYFPLEDSLQKVMVSMVSYRLAEQYQIRISPKDLLSNRFAVDSMTIRRVEECYDYFSRLEDVLEVYDGFTKPSEIRDICLSEASRWGHITYNSDRRVIDYEPTQDVHMFCIVDNYVNLTGGETDHKTIGGFSKVIARLELSKHLGFTVVGIIQQEMSKEKVNFQQDGEIIVQKLLPAMEGYGVNKEVARDSTLILGLFSPARYKIPRFPVMTAKDNAFDISRLGNFFRSLHVLKNNDGDADFMVPLFFDGCTEHFQEMPSLQDQDRVQKMYAYADKLLSVPSTAPLLFG